MTHLRFRDYLAVAGGILGIALSLSFAHVTSVGGAGSAPVTVVNTPLPVQGTVNVGNFPGSNAVTGSVSITGTPNVNVTNTAANPVPTQNVGGGAATHVGQPARNLVNLSCQFPSAESCVQAFSVPAGQAFVITDLQWSVFTSLGQGNYEGVALTVNSNLVALVGGLVDGDGFALGQNHLGTGIVVTPGQQLSVTRVYGTSGFIHLVLVQGYLVANQ